MKPLVKVLCCTFFLASILIISGCRRAQTFSLANSPTPVSVASPVPTNSPSPAPANLPPPTRNSATPVPAEYQSLYAELAKPLDDFANRLNAQPKIEPRALTFAAELLPANGNRGEELLSAQAYQATLLYLDRLQSLGVRGVKVAIKYPLLSPDFPRSSEYLAFYKKVAQELKQRKITMLAGTGIVFADPAFSNVPVKHRGWTLDQLKQEMRRHTETSVREIQPDYVTVANEPSTETELTGVAFNVRDFTDYVNFVLQGLDRKGVLVGAGTGNWDDPAYIESLAKNTSVDYIGLHIYPVNRDYLARAIQDADLARAHAKRIWIRYGISSH